MDFAACVVSTNRIATLFIEQVLSRDSTLRRCYSANSGPGLECGYQESKPCVFLLDTCALPLERSALCRLFRVRRPLSKFLALLPPERIPDDEILRLLAGRHEAPRDPIHLIRQLEHLLLEADAVARVLR